MNYITEVEGLAGKTIESAKFFDIDESIILRFADGEAAIIHTVSSYGDVELVFQDEDDLDFFRTMDAGIITQEEYDAFVVDETLKRSRAIEAEELYQLAALKAKYPDM